MEKEEKILKRLESRQKSLQELSAYLTQLESQLSLLFAHSPDLIVLSKKNGEILKINNSSIKILGYHPSEMIGKNILNFVAEEDLEKTLEFRSSLVEDGKDFGFFVKNDLFFTNRWKKKDSSLARLVWRYAFYDNQHELFIKFATDFSEIPVENPAVSDILVRSINNSTTGFVITNALMEDNPIIYVNDSFCEITGFERKELIGGNCRILNAKNRNQEAIKAVRECIKNGTGGSFLFKNFKPNGECWYNYSTIDPVVENGFVAKFIGSCRDVTQLVKEGEIVWSLTAKRGFGKLE